MHAPPELSFFGEIEALPGQQALNPRFGLPDRLHRGRILSPGLFHVIENGWPNLNCPLFCTYHRY